MVTRMMQARKAGSHAQKGWERLTDAVIAHVTQHQKGVVFMLWGKHAQKRKAAIKPNGHMVLEAPHPSGLSAHRGFFGCKHFSKCNAFLEKQGVSPINWTISI
jgi:uracil-DNA glycosylase